MTDSVPKHAGFQILVSEQSRMGIPSPLIDNLRETGAHTAVAHLGEGEGAIANRKHKGGPGLLLPRDRQFVSQGKENSGRSLFRRAILRHVPVKGAAFRSHRLSDEYSNGSKTPHTATAFQPHCPGSIWAFQNRRGGRVCV